jgi:hypothetical protein
VADFDLLDDGAAVGVLVFDGVFDGDDVVAAAGVDALDERGHGGGFAASGGAGEEDEALTALGEAGEDGGEIEGFDGGDLRGEETDAGGESAALVVEVGAEAAGGAADETEVERAVGFEFFGLLGGEEREEEIAEVFGGEGFAVGLGIELGVDLDKGAVDSEGDGGAGDEDDVGGVLFGGEAEEGVDGGAGVGPGAGGGAIDFSDKLRQIAFVDGHQTSGNLWQ